MPAKVTGLRETVKQLEALGVDVDDLKDAFAEIAALGAESAAQHAPIRTGALRKSIRGNRAKNKAIVTAGSRKVDYAPVINYGSPSQGIKPRLFMQAADADVAPRAVDILEKGIATAIEKNGL